MLRLPCSNSVLVQRLLDWYGAARRDLPWRDDGDPYRIWVAETMLQQTGVKVVVPYYERFLSSFPAIQDLAAARKEDVLQLWSGLGYYRRAENLWKSARLICEQHAGKFPRSRAQALQLPGVGPYTAGAVLSFAYGLPHPVLDGNIKRALARLMAVRQISPGVERSFWKLLEQLVEDPVASQNIRDFNQALMELGATVCKPQSPDCSRCPLIESCQAVRSGDAAAFPAPRKRRDIEKFSFISAVILGSGNRILLKKSQSEPYLKGLWEYPKISHPAARPIDDEFRRQHGVRLRVLRRLRTLRHQVTFRQLSYSPVVCELLQPPPSSADWVWADLENNPPPVSSYVLKVWKQFERGADRTGDG